MAEEANVPIFTVKPAGSNPDGINDWYDLDAIFQDDFFPQDVDFSGLMNEDGSDLAPLRQFYGGAMDSSNSPRQLQQRKESVDTRAPASKSKRKAAPKVEEEEDSENDMDLSDGQRVERRDRNREHAKRSRIRKRVLLDTLQDQLTELRRQNVKLRRVVAENLPPQLAAEVLLRCTTEESTLLAPCSTAGSGGDGDGSAAPAPASASKITGLQWAPSQQSNSGSAKTPKILMEPDYRLIYSLITSQQNFVLSDPSLPDNPIVYASDGFCRLSGYRRQDVLGRNCRFLQGPGTDPAAVNVIRKGIQEGRDVSVCLLNYRADGSPFWNQFFLGALKDSAGHVVNYVGVQCEVNTLPVAGMKERVKKLPLPGV